MFQNGPIRKVITKKVIFEDFLIFSPACSKLRKILEDFFKKSQVRNSHYLFEPEIKSFIFYMQSCDFHFFLCIESCYVHWGWVKGTESWHLSSSVPIRVTQI